MAAGASAENFGHSARKSGGGQTVSRRRSSCGRWMVYNIVQGQENRPMSYRSRKIGIQQKCSGRRGIYVFLGRRLKTDTHGYEKAMNVQYITGRQKQPLYTKTCRTVIRVHADLLRHLIPKIHRLLFATAALAHFRPGRPGLPRQGL